MMRTSAPSIASLTSATVAPGAMPRMIRDWDALTPKSGCSWMDSGSAAGNGSSGICAPAPLPGSPGSLVPRTRIWAVSPSPDSTAFRPGTVGLTL